MVPLYKAVNGPVKDIYIYIDTGHNPDHYFCHCSYDGQKFLKTEKVFSLTYLWDSKFKTIYSIEQAVSLPLKRFEETLDGSLHLTFMGI